MKVAVFSDIHGNYQALDAILNDIKNENIDKIIFLGDSVSLGPCPNECIDRLIKENNLSQGQLHKNSIYVCEVILTSDNTFFNGIGKKETKRYFKECFKFMTEYNGIGKENILTAVVHLDEETPHMHLVYMPVVNAKDKKGNTIRKISASEFWKGKDSYKKLQNQFYKYITEKGFDLERGKENTDREHIATDDMKKLTNFYDIKQLKENLTKQKEQMISYKDIQDFYKYEDFTKNNIDKNQGRDHEHFA